ncbi:hypothetical protein XA68_15556 [Ophiocordyceps unilateralis]|uniref:NADPH-dependent FMN reductase-like domain-containing protein n=1 Tax=Ophiocordyceps unilateralis TaxID=268505 RepID=A0A2A9P7V9_OPHUN|nr:hypothetical protein XA68_15556 [Ophiocordyceps unilateralis]
MTPRVKLALVTCSTRNRRLNPYITSYVQQVMAPLCNSVKLEAIDLASQALPIFDETVIPAQLPEGDPTPHYAKEHTRVWSAVARNYDGFVFVTPQYNWSVPAGLKNALDYLYHEWKDKPAGIVSYGGRGGGKAAGHLRDILTGLRMRTVAMAPALTISSSMMVTCEELGAVGEDEKRRWRETGAEEQLEIMAREMMQKLSME